MSYSQHDFLNTARPLAEELIRYATEHGTTYNITDVKVSLGVNEKQKNSVESGEVAETSGGKSIGVTVTLYSGDRVLSFSKNSFDLPTIKRAMDENMQTIHLVPENPDRKLLEPELVFKGTAGDLETFDASTITQEELIDYAKRLESATYTHPLIKSSRETRITRSITHSFTLATNGLELAQSHTRYSAVTSAIAENADGMQVHYEGASAIYFKDLPAPEALGATAAQEAAAKLSPSLPQAGEMPVVLSPDAAEDFFQTVYEAIDGTEVYRGTTFLKDQIGEQVMSRGVTMIDDPRIKRGLGSSWIDSSGTVSEAITFIEDGILKSYNMNLKESRQLNLPSIGRNDGPTNTSILPGTQSVEELIADIKEGVYIKQFKGGVADVNNGIHSREASGLIIRNGAITAEPVSGFVAGGNLKHMFMNVTLANDTPKHPSTKHTIAAPTTRINGMTISSAK